MEKKRKFLGEREREREREREIYIYIIVHPSSPFLFIPSHSECLFHLNCVLLLFYHKNTKITNSSTSYHKKRLLSLFSEQKHILLPKS